MRLDQLVERAGLDRLAGGARIVGDGAVEIRSVVMDSRQVEQGCLFACVPGASTDGHRYAPVAVAGGAAALLVERELDTGASQLVVSSVRRSLGPVCHEVFGRPSEHLRVVGVTGTNGKTTTVAFLQAIFEANGWPTMSIGTLSQARTTPEAPELHARLARWRAEGGQAVAMEVSSHALDQHRIDSTHLEAGIFTNLSPEHLDYHRSMDRYFEAKARLFAPGRVGVAVIGVDDEWGRRMAERVRTHQERVATFSLGDAEDLDMTASGTAFTWRRRRLAIALAGTFNVANALAAATCADALGVPEAVIVDGLASLRSVRGRFELVDAGQDFTVIVDYAHTPDGLRKVLEAGRRICSGRLIVVFGAGGDRDREKRPLMGEAAAGLADLVLVTSDNPRGEDPDAIIAEIVAGTAGADHVRPVTDRALAISAAVSAAAPGDVIIIAGKGHEKGQDIAGRTLPFDDVEVARTAISRVVASRAGGTS